MRIGVFDSGLGGLAIAHAIIQRLPQYDYLYLGDTKRVPYGGRSQETIHEFTSEALNFLFVNDCQLVILACNTASAEALRKSQQEYLPRFYPDRRILGMIIPAAEEVATASQVGVLATVSTCESGAYQREIRNQNPAASVIAVPAPLLVPLIENDGIKYLDPVLDDYLSPLREVESIVLGCTHYCLIKEQIRARTTAQVISQDEVVPEKLADYLHRHPEIETRLARTGDRQFCVTDITPANLVWARQLVGPDVQLRRVDLV